MGGLNRFGEPNFRVIWSSSHLDWIGGRWTDYTETGEILREVVELRYVPKYSHLPNRWIVEQWLPPEKFGSIDAWYRQTKEWGEHGNIPQLGPYPSRGRYALLCIVNDYAGAFVQLTPTVLEEVIYALIEKKRKPQTLAEKQEEIAKREQAFDAWSREFVNDGRPTFNGEPMVSVL